MTAFYNEHDKDAAAWLRSLIAAGQIAPGIVDERSIEDVRPDELAGFTQCHFFAGIGIWSLALRAAGVSDDTPVWTGSCPCQPFSSAGKGAGFDDERHLWPAWQHLISQCKPPKILGEQVASKDTNPWVNLVHTDLEAMGYAFGCVPFASACVGAPHIRDRAYWVADAGRADHRGEINAANHGQPQADRPADQPCGCGGASCELADIDSELRDGCGQRGPGRRAEHSIGGCACGLANTQRIGLRCAGLGPYGAAAGGMQGQDGKRERLRADAESGGAVLAGTRPGPVNAHWAAADWLHCRDGKWRPVEPGTSPLAYGMPRSMGAMSPELQRLAELAGLSVASLKSAKAYRTGSLKGYGNAINAKAAQAFIECVMEAP